MRAAGVTPTAWSPGEEITLAEWLQHGKRFGSIGRAVGWWLGDWLRYGNSRFGDRYARAARITGYDVQTLTNMVYVSSRFDADERREGLSWSHHAAVAQLEPPERMAWLDLAQRERMSVRCLREAIRRSGHTRNRHAAEGQTHRALTCPSCGVALRREQSGLVEAP
jgi:hypothetical protein